MRRLLKGVSAQALVPGLEFYFEGGLHVGDDGEVFAASMLAGAHSPRDGFASLVDYEAFLNKIHIGDFVDSDLSGLLSQALTLVERLGHLARCARVSVAALVSVDHDAEDVTLRFHGIRPNEPLWIDDDLDAFEQPVLLRISGA